MKKATKGNGGGSGSGRGGDGGGGRGSTIRTSCRYHHLTQGSQKRRGMFLSICTHICMHVYGVCLCVCVRTGVWLCVGVLLYSAFNYLLLFIKTNLI